MLFGLHRVNFNQCTLTSTWVRKRSMQRSTPASWCTVRLVLIMQGHPHYNANRSICCISAWAQENLGHPLIKFNPWYRDPIAAHLIGVSIFLPDQWGTSLNCVRSNAGSYKRMNSKRKLVMIFRFLCLLLISIAPCWKWRVFLEWIYMPGYSHYKYLKGKQSSYNGAGTTHDCHVSPCLYICWRHAWLVS